MTQLTGKLIGFIALIAFSAGLSADSAVPEISLLDGRYVIDATQSDNIDQVINRSVADFNFIIRPIARSRLTKTNPTYQRIKISRDAHSIMVTLDNRKPITMPLDGSTIEWVREDGEKFKVHAGVKPETLLQTFVADEGRRINRFQLIGQKLVLQVTLESDQLSKPITYLLSYRRE